MALRACRESLVVLAAEFFLPAASHPSAKCHMALRACRESLVVLAAEFFYLPPLTL